MNNQRKVYNPLFGLIPLLVGFFIIAISFLGPAEDFNAPRWVVGLAGVCFSLAGVAVITSRNSKGTIVSTLIAFMICSGFAAIFGWVTFGAKQYIFVVGFAMTALMSLLTLGKFLKELGKLIDFYR